MPTLKQIRAEHYSYHNSAAMTEMFDVDPNNFWRSPYTFLKSRYYMETSSLLLYVLLRTTCTANQVTMFYIISAPIGALLIGVGEQLCVILGSLIFFNRGVLDWTDGQLARWKNESSVKGHLLDTYGAKLGSISLKSGLSFFVYNSTGFIEALCVGFLIIFVDAASLLRFASFSALELLNSKKIFFRIDGNRVPPKIRKNKSAVKASIDFAKKFKGVLDDRARNTDFILLMMFIDLQLKTNAIAIIIILFLVRGLVSFAVDSYQFHKHFDLYYSNKGK